MIRWLVSAYIETGGACKSNLRRRLGACGDSGPARPWLGGECLPDSGGRLLDSAKSLGLNLNGHLRVHFSEVLVENLG